MEIEEMEAEKADKLTAFKAEFEQIEFEEHQRVGITPCEIDIEIRYQTMYHSDLVKIEELCKKHKMMFFLDVIDGVGRIVAH